MAFVTYGGAEQGEVPVKFAPHVLREGAEIRRGGLSCGGDELALAVFEFQAKAGGGPLEDAEGAQDSLSISRDDDIVEVGGDDVQASLVLAEFGYLFQHWLEG